MAVDREVRRSGIERGDGSFAEMVPVPAVEDGKTEG